MALLNKSYYIIKLEACISDTKCDALNKDPNVPKDKNWLEQVFGPIV